jgi:hypothetical protein
MISVELSLCQGLWDKLSITVMQQKDVTISPRDIRLSHAAELQQTEFPTSRYGDYCERLPASRELVRHLV